MNTNYDFVLKFAKYIENRSIYELRLPLNNNNARFEIIKLNENELKDILCINYILNTCGYAMWSDSNRKVIPPTFGELLIYSLKMINWHTYNFKKIDFKNDFGLDVYLQLINDVYSICNNTTEFINSGLAEIFLKYGTWEDNKCDDGFEYVTFETDNPIPTEEE